MKHKVLSITGSTRGTAYSMSNKILTSDGKTHVVWLDQISKSYARTYFHKTKRWGKPVHIGTGDDNHAGPALAMDSKGYLHVLFGPHHNPLQYAVSKRPNTSTSWVPQESLGGVCATYPSLICDSDDTLHVCYRGAVDRERPWGIMYQRKPKGGDWTAPVKLLDAQGPPAYTQYTNALHVARDGTIYLSFHIVRATEQDHKDTKGRGFGIMRSRDGGDSWRAVGGSALDLPATPDSPCVLEFDEGIDVRMSNVTCDRARSARPYFTLNRRKRGVPETALYRWGKDRWEEISLLAEVERLQPGCAMWDTFSVSFGDDGVLYAAGPIGSRDGGWSHESNEMVLLTSRDGGDSFSAYRVSDPDPDAPSWLPSLERQTGHNKVSVPSLIYTHGLVGEGCSPDVNTEIRFVSLEDVATAEQAKVDAEIRGATRLAGLNFTAEQIGEMRSGVEQIRSKYKALREVALPADLEPPSVFVPGTPPAVEDDPVPFRLAPLEVARPDSEEDLAFLGVPALARLIERKEISPVELTRLYLDRLSTLGPRLNCLVTLTEDLALKQASAAETEILRGQYRGPLHGIPWGAKDLLAARGYPTTWGATPYRDQVIDRDAAVVEKLRDAGAVLVAKLSLGALANGAHWFGGMTRNPWALEKESSGSSAGPGAATAAGLVGFSIGSETLGSIVSPSTVCGVTGLRPTYGRVSRYGAMALSWSMDKLGPMCRGVEGCAAVFDAIRGADGRDRSVVDALFAWCPDANPATLRVGYIESEFKEISDQAEAALHTDALEVLHRLGMKPAPVSLPDYPLWAITMVLGVEAAASFDDATRSGALDVMVGADKSDWPGALRGSRAVTAVEYLRAQRVRSALMRDMDRLMRDWDILVTPPWGNASLALTNLTGHPSVTVPCGFVDGTPRSVTFTGRLYEEATVLRAARAYEQATEWRRQRPDLSKLDCLESTQTSG
jgi:Asp-tRNA(Asn)/Glu-tRNA(Gln) amidotransferase A subunit family amidase